MDFATVIQFDCNNIVSVVPPKQFFTFRSTYFPDVVWNGCMVDDTSRGALDRAS